MFLFDGILVHRCSTLIICLSHGNIEHIYWKYVKLESEVTSAHQVVRSTYSSSLEIVSMF